jgi:hypothetical protein
MAVKDPPRRSSPSPVGDRPAARRERAEIEDHTVPDPPLPHDHAIDHRRCASAHRADPALPFPRDPPSDGKPRRVDRRDRQIDPADVPPEVEPFRDDSRADVDLGVGDDHVLGLERSGGGADADGPLPRPHGQADIAGEEGRLEAVGADKVDPHLGELEKLAQRDQGFVAAPIGGDRAGGEAAQGQLDDDRLDRVSRNGLQRNGREGARQREGGGDHGRSIAMAWRAGAALSTCSGGRSDRWETSSSSRR